MRASSRIPADAEELAEFLGGRGPDAADALRHARILVRAADLVTRARQHTDPEQTVFAARDRYTAEALAADLLEDPSAKIALWAHNGHLTKNRGAVPALGQHPHARYGDAYYALGLPFGSGSFRARRTWPGPWRRPQPRAVVTHRIGPHRPGSVEGRLAGWPARTPATTSWTCEAPPEHRRPYGSGSPDGRPRGASAHWCRAGPTAST